MKVCILGNNLTSLVLAKTLSNMGITIDIICVNEISIIDKTRTLAISKYNIEFFNKKILNINKLLWKINKIEIYNENLKNEKILNFLNNNEYLFSMIKNYELYTHLIKDLKKNKLIKFKKKINYSNITDNYKLIFNCDYKNLITKKYFFKTIKKNYKSSAYTAIINHTKMKKNDIAFQIFTQRGPFAFLPISNTKTSVVFSIKELKNVKLEDFIKKYNTKYNILKISTVSKFQLSSSSLRSYYYKNIIAFGDLLHKIHPLAGQGFNMSIRDISEIEKLIKYKLNNGLDLDQSICLDFEKKTKHKNLIFSSGVDLIYEFFNFEKKFRNDFLIKFVKLLGKNNSINKFLVKAADRGVIN